MIENWEAAAAKKSQPIVLWSNDGARVMGVEPSQGNREALSFALSRPQARAAEFAEATSGMSIANASTKFKQLWEQGFSYAGRVWQTAGALSSCISASANFF
jgi:hypothetical protein